MLTDPAAQPFTNQWMVYDYWQRADNPAVRIDAKYDTSNVQIHDKLLKMQQLGYTVDGKKTEKHISMAGLQSRRLDIIHGTFRTTFKVEGANGGSCASFFWYRNDASELDIEAVTQGTSLVNNTINYTTQPSIFPDGSPIPNSTRSVPLADEFNTDIEVFREHRFDCDRAGGAKFYLDGELTQVDAHNIPKFGGSLQLKLWADGNKWWSGIPSTTTVTMSVRSVIAYFNTSGTEDGTDKKWFNACTQAGGPSDENICEAYAEPGKNDNLPLAASGVPPAQTSTTPDVVPIGPDPTQRPMSDNNLGNDECYTTVRSGVLGVGLCKKSQAVRAQPLGLNSIHKFLTSCMPKLRARSPPVPSDAEVIPANRSPTHAADQCVLDPLGDDCTHKSQATRGEPPMWSTIQKLFSYISNRLFAREEPDYTLPFGSPTKNQAARVRGPSWFDTLYARNSTPVRYKALGRERSSGSNSTPTSSHLQKQAEHADPRDKCEKEKFNRCSISEMRHIGQWWQCLNERSDWCFFFGGSSFLLTNGLIQIVSVPVIFAWVFYLTET